MTPRKRSAGEQVKSGAIIAGEFVGGFLVFMLAMVGVIRLISNAPTSHFREPLTAWIEVFVAAIIMFATAERWAGIIPGFFLLRGIFGGIAYSIFPATAEQHPHGMTRPEAAFLLVYSVVVTALLWRFIPPRKIRTTFVDRTALTIFALSIAILLQLFSSSAALPAAVLGCVPPLIAWVVYRWNHRKRVRQHHSGALPDASLDPLENRRGGI
jgi:hypothetical protein